MIRRIVFIVASCSPVDPCEAHFSDFSFALVMRRSLQPFTSCEVNSMPNTSSSPVPWSLMETETSAWLMCCRVWLARRHCVTNSSISVCNLSSLIVRPGNVAPRSCASAMALVTRCSMHSTEFCSLGESCSSCAMVGFGCVICSCFLSGSIEGPAV